MTARRLPLCSVHNSRTRLELYNEHLSRPSFAFIAPMALGAMPMEKHPSACIGCGSCAAVCPQQIDIPETLDHFAQLMGER